MMKNSVHRPDFLETVRQIQKTVAPLTDLVRQVERAIAPTLAVLNRIDWEALRRLAKLPEKSKEAMKIAAAQGWFFGWEGSLQDVIQLVEKLGSIEAHEIDECLITYYRNNLQSIANKLITRHPKRASVIEAAVKAHTSFGDAGFFLSVPAFIAQADGILTEITQVEGSALLRHGKNDLKGSQALRERLRSNQGSLDLLFPLLEMLPDLDLMKSSKRRAIETSGGFAALNRHQVMHGESCDYGTEINSLKAFSFLTFVGLHLPLVLEGAETSQDDNGTEPEGGLDPAIQSGKHGVRGPWMPGSSPGMTNE